MTSNAPEAVYKREVESLPLARKLLKHWQELRPRMCNELEQKKARAPIQARNGRRPSGRILVTPSHHLSDGQILSNLWGPPHDTFGRSAYERLRARAIILLLRFYGLRVSDLATLARHRVKADHIYLHALKNGAPIWLPVYPEVSHALNCLPLPQGAAPDCKYFFWTGNGSREGHIKTVDRTLQAVFRKSGVERAHAHRFRHTLATEVLVKGGTIEDAANILGDSPATIEKYYAKWSVA